MPLGMPNPRLPPNTAKLATNQLQKSNVSGNLGVFCPKLCQGFPTFLILQVLVLVPYDVLYRYHIHIAAFPLGIQGHPSLRLIRREIRFLEPSSATPVPAVYRWIPSVYRASQSAFLGLQFRLTARYGSGMVRVTPVSEEPHSAWQCMLAICSLQ